jgi:methionine-rich copper-binding protein CopC
MIPRHFRRVFAILLLALSFGGDALAHAVVMSSIPAVDATIYQPSPTITVHFNSRIDLDLSTLTLLPPAGDPVKLPLGDASTIDTLVTQAHDLKPGNYRIRWQVLSVDGHITRGDIPFTVAASATPTP